MRLCWRWWRAAGRLMRSRGACPLAGGRGGRGRGAHALLRPLGGLAAVGDRRRDLYELDCAGVGGHRLLYPRDGLERIRVEAERLAVEEGLDRRGDRRAADALDAHGVGAADEGVGGPVDDFDAATRAAAVVRRGFCA